MEKSFLIGSCRRFANFRFRRIGAEAFDNDFFAGSPRRFPHFRVRRTGSEKLFFAEALWNLATFGSAGKLFGSSYDRIRKLFWGKSYAVCSFSGPYTVWDLNF